MALMQNAMRQVKPLPVWARRRIRVEESQKTSLSTVKSHPVLDVRTEGNKMIFVGIRVLLYRFSEGDPVVR